MNARRAMATNISHTLLLVEDNADNAELATWILEDANYKITPATTAEAALEALEEAHFNLILMDISLPGMDGKEAIKIIRANPLIANTPIIALTAHAILQERDSIMESGADYIITKPLDEDVLLAKIAELIKTHQGTQP